MPTHQSNTHLRIKEKTGIYDEADMNKKVSFYRNLNGETKIMHEYSVGPQL